MGARKVLQYLCLQASDSERKRGFTQLLSCTTIQHSNVAVTLARILVCKPHAADCERIISAYNRLTSTFRNSLDRQTDNC